MLISNTHGVFQPIESDAYIGANPGSNKAVPVGQMKGRDKVIKIIIFLHTISMNSVLVQVIGHIVDSVTVRDLLSVTLSPSSTYIIKTDIEDFDCEVL